ncbi:MAG TPA: TonB-dependent receptor [Pyrinomonadaceae bacterium]|nr:TonB-dependent receptor [Pyrinomonadaceae bacterium]
MTTCRRITHLLPGVGVLCLLLAAFALPTYGQTNKGTIKGTVTDQNGGIVQNATVVVTNVGTNAERTISTSDEGTYEAPLLDPGTYRVAVSAPTFSTATQENVVVQTSSTQVVDITLTAGEVGGTVTVTSAPTLVESETSERGSVVTGREVTELPLSGRNFTLLATLTPGVARASNAGFGGAGPDARQFNNGDPRAGSGGPNASNAQGDTPTARFARSGAGTLTVNGQRPTNNNFSLDGVDNNEPQFGTIGVFPNPDAIAEFKVTTSVPPAEVGRAAGAVINTTTKSGTNEFHGSLYYYGQNSALNAFHPILKRDRSQAISRGDTFIPDKAVQQIHEYGGTIGGPIIRNKTFFFFDYLGQRNNIPFPFTSTVPTALSREGDFSDFPAIRDPATCHPVTDPGPPPTTTTVCDPFPGNIIPANRISPIAQTILRLYPLPTRNIFDPSQGNANYASLRQNREVIDNFGIKIDHRISDNNSLTGRFNNQKLKNVRENFFPVSITGAPGLPTAGFGAGEEVGNTRQLVITDTHTFSPSVLNEFRFGLTKINIGINNCGVLGACGVSETWSSDVGIPNSNLGGEETSGGLGLGTTGRGFVEFLGDGGLFRAKSTNPYFADTLTIIKGSHVIKTGGEARVRYLNTVCGGCAGAEKGQIGFNDGNTGNAQADMLLDLPNFAQRSRTIGGPFNLRMQEYGLFVQDDWKVNDRLTLNLGLRYDILPGPTAPTEADGRLSYYFPEEQQVVVASGSGDRLVEMDKNNFGPRIGFAYSVNDEKTLILRGGYGLLYTLDGVDYPPGVRNPPFTNISFSLFTLAQGPPVITEGIDPVNVPAGTSLFTVDREQRNGMVHQFQLSFQYQFADDWSIDVGYVGNRSRNLLATFQEGSGGQGIARNLAGDLIGSVLLYSNAADSSYDSLQVQVQKRLSRNIQGQISYTWGHTIDNATGVFNGLGDSKNQGRNGPVHPFDLDFDKGNSVLDIRHLLSANAIVDLPFGKGQRYLNEGGISNAIFGGWQMNVIVSGRSGFPFSVVCQCGLIRPSLIGDPFSGVAQDRYLNPAAFSTSTGITSVVNEAGQTVSFGNLGRNSFRGPAIWNTDLSFFKNAHLPFTEDTRMQIGIELFNAFNHTNLTVPNNNVNDPGAFGRFDGAYPGRVIQYRFKILF